MAGFTLPTPRHRSLLIGGLVGLLILATGTLLRPTPPALATNTSGDPTLIAQARPLLTGMRDHVSIAVIEGDNVRYANFGATDQTEYEIGSLTKTFTALLFADAIRRGEVRPETTLGSLLPLGDAPAAKITLAELASHHSGLPRLGDRPQEMLQTTILNLTLHDPYPFDTATLLAQARAAKLANRGQFAYSNFGMALLGQALAAAAHIDYAQLVQDRLFTPLGLSQTSLPVVPANLPPNATTGWAQNGQPARPWTLRSNAPAGGIRSTSADMVRYAQALLNGTAPGMAALTPQTATDHPDEQIGYAWFVRQESGRTITWHNGGTGGFSSILLLDREQHRAVLVLANTAVSVDGVGAALLTGETK